MDLVVKGEEFFTSESILEESSDGMVISLRGASELGEGTLVISLFFLE